MDTMMSACANTETLTPGNIAQKFLIYFALELLSKVRSSVSMEVSLLILRLSIRSASLSADKRSLTKEHTAISCGLIPMILTPGLSLLVVLDGYSEIRLLQNSTTLTGLT
jgi:hypothetical protein